MNRGQLSNSCIPISHERRSRRSLTRRDAPGDGRRDEEIVVSSRHPLRDRERGSVARDAMRAGTRGRGARVPARLHGTTGPTMLAADQ